jgi:ADP-ribosyl-[dinitrogen reductase] hydrolase
MRLAPIPLAFRADAAQAGESSRTTHGAPAAIDGCKLYAAMILAALAGRSKEEILIPALYQGSLVQRSARFLLGRTRRRIRPRSLAPATWSDPLKPHSGLSTDNALSRKARCWPRTWATMPIRPLLSMDNWGGAYYGAEAIPAGWLEKLAMREFIEQMADQLRALSENLAPAKKGEVSISG